MKITYDINAETMQDCINLSLGVFAPLTGFMNSADYHRVADEMLLESGDVWTIPISLDVDHVTFLKAANSSRLYLRFNSFEIGYLEINDVFQVNNTYDIIKIFDTADITHPGVEKEQKRHIYRVGGEVFITARDLLTGSLDPCETKKRFKDNRWRTIAGFQTRNPIHKAHEHLQRIALEVCDGLFINPLVGWKKVGDFSEDAVIDGYQAMLTEYYFGLNVHIENLKTPMRYAGPREAIFHAIIRRNLGCTHFIIGRDHAGVGNFYGKYAAHDLAKYITSKHDLGISLLLLSEPYYCHKCAQIVSDKTCAHEDDHVERISGTKIREMLAKNQRPPELMMRSEISDAIIQLGDNKFITD